MLRILKIFMAVGVSACVLHAEEIDVPGVVFEKHILPIFQNSCFECHSDPAQRKGKKPKGGLRLDSPAYIRAGGDSGASFVAGKPDKSLLYQLIALPEDDDDVMPSKGALLTQDQTTVIRRWIESGGKFDDWEGEDGLGTIPESKVEEFEISEVPNVDEMDSAPVDASAFAREIDQIVADELTRLEQTPRPKIDEYTFCRRVYLDAIGRIPTINELDSFIADDQPDKRAKLIDKLLNSKGYNSHWYNYWADLLRVKNVGDKLHHAGNFSEWIKDSVRSNKAYNQMAHELINARGELYKPGNGATGFYAREPMLLDHLANSVKTFMGMSIECAQCHDHPSEDWTQQDFYKLAAFASKTRLKVDPLPKDEKETYAKDREMLKQKDFDEWIVYRESVRVKHAAIYGNGTGFMRLPHDYQYDDAKPHQVMVADVLFGKMPEVNYRMTKEKLETLSKSNFGPEVNSRNSMADWMTSIDNPMFTKATVNRLWHKVMGTELAGQLGGLTQETMGKHPALTQKLITIMKGSNYDAKVFLGTIFRTKTYQSRALALPAKPPAYVLDGPIVRRLSAEVIVDSFLSLKTETPDKSVATEFRWDGFTNFYEKSQDMTVEDFVDYSIKGPGRAKFQNREEKEAEGRNSDMGPEALWRVSTYGRNYRRHWVSMLMGKSNRELIDSGNREPDIPQILYLMNGLGIPEAGLIKRKLQSAESHEEKMVIIWKAILGRLPKDSEKPLFKNAPNDIIWALLNSNEFRFVR
ncbi:PSD1 and planctomycete cytochrome C domain-containing protein [Verrucomicrobia bacterium]|nr:PSD1 and planctomycete cytochrome C domain-containing protein [Verrucomicrobiota bacterium]